MCIISFRCAENKVSQTKIVVYHGGSRGATATALAVRALRERGIAGNRFSCNHSPRAGRLALSVRVDRSALFFSVSEKRGRFNQLSRRKRGR